MKTFYFLVFLFLINSAAIQSQVTSAGQRPLYFKYFEEEGNIVWIDAREGLKMPAEDLISGDSISMKLFGKNWILSDQLIDYGMVEFIPAGQDHETWEEIITVQRLDAEGKSLKNLHKKLRKIREKNCPGQTAYSRIIKEEKKILLFESRVENCEKFGTQSEIKIMLAPPTLTLFQYTVWIVEYTKRGDDIDPAKREQIQKWLNSHRLLNYQELQAFLR